MAQVTPDSDRERIFTAGDSTSREGTAFVVSIILKRVNGHNVEIQYPRIQPVGFGSRVLLSELCDVYRVYNQQALSDLLTVCHNLFAE